MAKLLEPDIGDTLEDLRDFQDLLPATVTATRTSESDFKSRQLIVWIDGERVATLLWGDSITAELQPGRHRIRVSNTLVWKTVELELKPWRGGVLRGRQPDGPRHLRDAGGLRCGPPLYVTLKRMD